VRAAEIIPEQIHDARAVGGDSIKQVRQADLGAIPYDKAVLTVEAAALALVADDMHRVAGVI